MILINILNRGIATAFYIVLLGISSHLCAQGTQDENSHYELAQRIFNDGLYADAAREYKQFIINYPTSERLPDAMLRVGQAHARAEQYDRAREAFQQFIDRYPTHIEVASAMRARAHALSQIGEHTRSGAAYRDVHAAYPASTNAPQDLLSAGENYHKGGALTEASAAYRQLVAQYPKSPIVNEATFNLGRVLLEQTRTEEALAQFRTLAEHPGPTKRKPDALLAMGNIALSRDNLQEAERIFANLRARYPATPAAQNAYLILGAWHAGKNDWTRAEKTYNNALATIPNNTRRQQALLGSANAKRKLGKSEGARQRYASFLRAYPKSPFHAHALLGYGRAFADLKNYRNALDAFKNLQEKYPDADVSIQAYGDIGNIWRALGTHQKALTAYQTYLTRIQSPSEKANARLHIAQLCEDLHWYDLAAENYRTLINSAIPHYAAEGQYGLARVFEKTGEPTLALREYRTYIKNHGDAAHAETAEKRIQILTEFGTETDRDRTWLELLANLPGIANDPHTQFILGKTLHSQKRYTRAIPYLETALASHNIRPSTHENITHGQSMPRPNTPATTSNDTLALAAKAARAAEAALAALSTSDDTLALANDETSIPNDTRDSTGAVPYASDDIFTNAPTWASEAYYLLGNSYLKQARRATLENKPPDAWQNKGLTTLKILVKKFPDNDQAENAALAIIHTETAHIQPDTLRAQTRLSTYRAYQKTHPNNPDLLLRIADAHFSNTHIDSALSLYLQVQKKADNPTTKEKVTYRIGLCQAQQQQHARAEDTLKNFLFNYPQSDLAPHAQFQLGRILLDREFYASAAEAFSELLSASPTLALQRSARSLLSESYHRLRNYQRAIEIDKSLITHNTTPQLLRRLAKSYSHNNQRDKAVTTYNMYLRKYPQAPDADSIAFTRAEHLTSRNRTSEALTAFREFSKKYPNSPLGVQADQAIGDLLFQTEKYAQAIAAYQRIPEPARNETMAAREVLSLYRLRRISQANKTAGQFKKTYKTATEWLARFEVEKGNYQLAVKNPKKAQQIFEDISKKYPTTEAEAEARYYIIRAYRDQGPDKDGNNEPYLNALSTFIKNYPDSPHWANANIELAEFWERNEEYNLSAHAYRNAIEKGVTQSVKPGILHKLAKNYSNLNAYDLAINFARQLLREFPQHPLAIEASIDIGTIYLPNKGDHAQAIAELRPLLKIVTVEDEKASIQYTIAENYFELADYENALREFLFLRYNQKAGPMWIVSAQMKIADCYAAQNNIEQAIQELEAIKRSHGVASIYGIGAEGRIQQIKAQSESGFTR